MDPTTYRGFSFPYVVREDVGDVAQSFRAEGVLLGIAERDHPAMPN